MTYTAQTSVAVEVLEGRLDYLAREIEFAQEDLESAQRRVSFLRDRISALGTEKLAIRQAIGKLQAGDD